MFKKIGDEAKVDRKKNGLAGTNDGKMVRREGWRGRMQWKDKAMSRYQSAQLVIIYNIECGVCKCLYAHTHKLKIFPSASCQPSIPSGHRQTGRLLESPQTPVMMATTATNTATA